MFAYLANTNIIFLCSVYIPPNSHFTYLQQLTAYLNSLVIDRKILLIIGDFNLPDICWSSLSGLSPSSNLLCDFVFDCNLTQLINSPAHVKGNTLDILLTNSDHLISHLSVSESDASLPFDHSRISFSITCNFTQITCCKSLYIFDYANADYEGLCDFLMDVNFSLSFQSDSIEYTWSLLKDATLRGMNLFIPKVRVTSRNFSKWFNSEIRHTIKCLQTHKKKCSLRLTANNQCKLRYLEAKLTNLISSAISEFEQSLSSHSSTKIFKYLNHLSSTSSLPPIVLLDSSFASSDMDKASLFNTLFILSIPRVSSRFPPGKLAHPSIFTL